MERNASGTWLESQTEDGDSPVREAEKGQAEIRSTTGHEESGGKQGGPPSNPKYYLMTDSGAVP